MSLAHAILGFLRRQSQTGYTLKNENFDKSVAYFWPADQTQIYKTLDNLVENGFASFSVEVQTDRPNRKIYSITKAGRAELERWLREEIVAPAYRDPLLVQTFFSEYVETAATLEVLRAARKRHKDILRTLKAIDIPQTAKCSSRQALGARLTLELGLKSKQAYIDWLDESIRALESFDKKRSK